MTETVDWNPLGDTTIRKCNLYDPMCWNPKIDLSVGFTSISKYGGMIAHVNVDSASSRSGRRPDVTIYNAAGKEVSSFRWNSGMLIGIAWTHSDDLLCLQEDGQVLLYNVFCQFQKSFTMGMECRENKVMEYEAFTNQHGTGLAVMNGLYRFLIVNNIDDPKVRILADVPGLKKTPPSSWCILPGPRSSRVLAANDNDIYLLDLGGQCHQQQPAGLSSSPSSYISMSVSLDGKHVVLFTNAGVLWIGSSDFQKMYCEFNTSNGRRPKQLLWCCESICPDTVLNNIPTCNNEAVVIYWPGVILVIGPKKDWVKYKIDEESETGSAILSVDIDGLHMVTSKKHDFLRHVPSSMQGIFKAGSMAPGALLNDATKAYDNGSEKADEYLRILLENNQLETAVDQCIEAAFLAFQPRIQKTLLQAAAFGKSFILSSRLTESFVATVQELRVLNAMRDFNTGIALTGTQLRHLTMECLIDRLVQRRHFRLAFEICKYLKIPNDTGSSRILSHWACYKVQQKDVSDEKIAAAIRNKLKSAVGVSYASIAEKSVECGRKELAIKLLEFEPRASEQVRLLSKLGKHQLALEKAVASGNTDLAYSAISSLRERSSLSEFLVAIRQQPVAYKLHLKHCRVENERMLKDLHEQEDDFLELAHLHIHDSYDTFRHDERLTFLHSALDCFSKARNDYCVKSTEEQLQLLREQSDIEEQGEGGYVETSLHDTLHNLLLANMIKKAEQLRKQFKVSDKRWWWLRISALAEKRNFIELENFSKSKKSPIGYLPFIEVCIKHNATQEVAKYIGRVAQDKRVSALIKTGSIDKAAEMALQSRNPIDIDLVMKKCGPEHRNVAEKLRDALNQLQRR